VYGIDVDMINMRRQPENEDEFLGRLLPPYLPGGIIEFDDKLRVKSA
jgi:hypothetical protein